MPPRRPETPTGRASGVARRGRRALHQQIVAGERELDRVWSHTERSLRASMRGLALSDVDEARIIASARREMRASFDARVAAITTTTQRSAQLGLGFGPDAASEAFDDIVRMPAVNPDRARAIATDHLFGPRAVRGLSLSARLHAHDEDTVRALAHELHTTIGAGLTVRQSAQRLLEVDDPHVHLPAYIREVRDAVRGGDARALRLTIDRHTSSIERLSTPELRAAGRDFMRRAETATTQDLDRQIGYWIRDRALHQEEVIVRTEAARAHHAAFLESTRDQPWVKGYRWNVSTSHPRPDICDLFANQAIDDLGPGGYTEENLPDLPAHPNCMCFVTTINDDDHFEREAASVTGGEAPPTPWVDTNHVTASDWLAQQPESVQRQMLGPTRHAAWLTDPSSVIGPSGRIAPVWQVEGRQPRARRFVERVRVASRDPFAEAGSRRPRPAPTPPPTPIAPPIVIAPTPIAAPPPPRPPRPRAPRPAPAPPAPAAPTVSREEVARRVLATTLRGTGRSLDQAGTRRALRAWLRDAFQGELTSHDVGRAHADVIETGRHSSTSGRRGSHAYTGRIEIASNVMRSARAGAASILRGQPVAEDERQSIRTFLHEEMHGHSNHEWSAYRGPGRVLEETAVELHAREATGRLLGAPMLSGSYPDYIAQVRSAVRIAYPTESDAAIDARIRGAARRAWSSRPESIRTASEYVDRFADGLALDPGVRPQVEQALRSMRDR